MTRCLPLVLALLFLDTGTPTASFRYQRAVHIAQAGQSCAVLDPALYTHAAASLADLRLYGADEVNEIPFVLLRSGSAQTESEPARILNLQQAGRSISFDLAMPSRVYTDVILKLSAPNLLVRAAVTAGNAAGASLGVFTLFDLTAQRLSSDTTLHLQETAAPLLHVTLTALPGGGPLAPAVVQGASVPPSREAQTLYTTALSTAALAQTAHRTLARFTVPAHLPIERVRVVLTPGRVPNFSRPVVITSHVSSEPDISGEQIRGSIAHIRTTRGGASLSLDQLTLPATLGANLQKPAEVEIAVENGADAPLPLASITLETRQRQICFNLATPAALTLFYGDSRLDPPQYGYEQHFRSDPAAHVAILGPEQVNPLYRPRIDVRPLTRRHPRLIALGTLLVLCLFAIIALRSKKLRL